ncbi:MAG: SUMF1/EgtB/PvdO family nonheme iron enzyme [Crocinitomicaceae bacterium]|nr:SUMF1/EgtB/PvdO family nonheme iron enzyme [Crocinitomicaceae bacterium]MDP4865148.1 SUMF1/EgtB/PvdO family nonheme iron enzyme [Crocinitomicaceae bacterium]MDP5099207.1 SUMF1/EgtB/PvdO family nonheme iron enzyme [Crocinitomicaceae bacterium]
MKNQKRNMQLVRFFSIVALGGTLFLGSCAKESSSSTGWNFNDPKVGGFQKVPFIDQETGPGLLLVEGGTFTMGRSEQDVMYDWNNRPTRVTVSSFYMDQTEVTNFHWLEYLYWISRAYETYPMVYKNALPDTLCWRTPLAFMEKYVDYYLRHPAYRDYPVVGVSWLQANDFCKWRTDRVNEYILVREGVLAWNVDQRDDNTFNTEAYYAGQYEEAVARNVQNLDPSKMDGKKLGTRIVKMEDGILLPRYRLPTEAEWEFAATGLIGNLQPGTENVSDRKIYPWNGHWVRNDDEQFQGSIRANFVRGRGDYMGVAGNLNDGADVTAPVDSYWPNDYGLYHMAGNVSEWVLDVYRPLSTEDFDEFRPFRGNVFKTKLLNNEGSIDIKSQQVTYDVHGMKEYLNEFERIRYQRISADKHDPNDTVVQIGLYKNVESRNPSRRGYAPDPFFVSHGNVKDSIELSLLARINSVLDLAIKYKNDKHDIEASTMIQDQLFDDIFANELRTGPDGEEYAFEIISMLRDGFTAFIIDTPGKLKYRNVTEEENIGRLNYRRDDYIDYLDGDIESSIYFQNDDLKNSINQASRDPNLIMYQSQHEKYGLDGGEIKPEGITSWPTTLVSDKSRVYKGGSWRDRAYWLASGSRRYLDEDKSTAMIGFRCAMDRIGSPTGMNYGKKEKKK